MRRLETRAQSAIEGRAGEREIVREGRMGSAGTAAVSGREK